MSLRTLHKGVNIVAVLRTVLLLALNLLAVHCLIPIETVAPFPEVASLLINDETLYTVPHAYLFKMLHLRFDWHNYG
jgi:hypothetical protein